MCLEQKYRINIDLLESFKITAVVLKTVQICVLFLGFFHLSKTKFIGKKTGGNGRVYNIN